MMATTISTPVRITPMSLSMLHPWSAQAQQEMKSHAVLVTCGGKETASGRTYSEGPLDGLNPLNVDFFEHT
jgi:hypothetical protein